MSFLPWNRGTAVCIHQPRDAAGQPWSRMAVQFSLSPSTSRAASSSEARDSPCTPGTGFAAWGSSAVRLLCVCRTTSDMSRVFCAHCGNKTLKKVSVTVSDDGTLHMHFSRNPKVLNPRGLRVSRMVPAPLTAGPGLGKWDLSASGARWSERRTNPHGFYKIVRENLWSRWGRLTIQPPHELCEEFAV